MFFIKENALHDVKLGDKNYGVFFIPQDAPVFSANEIFSIDAIFDSPEIDGGHGFISWDKLNVDCDLVDNSQIYIYVRNYDVSGEGHKASWVGPILKYHQYDVSDMAGKFFQIRALMSMNSFATESPKLNKISLSCYKIGEEEMFFTKALDLGFKPKHIFLTYNAPEAQDVMIRFAITERFDATDPFQYHDITPGMIENIEDVPISRYMKLMLSGIGKRTVPFVVDEFAFILSGDEQKVIK